MQSGKIGDGDLKVPAAARYLLTDQNVAERLDISRASVWRRVRDGTLPRPIRIGGATRFVAAEIDDFIAMAMARRDAGDI